MKYVFCKSGSADRNKEQREQQATAAIPNGNSPKLKRRSSPVPVPEWHLQMRPYGRADTWLARVDLDGASGQDTALCPGAPELKACRDLFDPQPNHLNHFCECPYC
ncbi:Hypothetical predicted protein [Marmota monax]|uniref:Uncharacterized protein n=1 Tax=Marmota monax TaxID=9995 RepID=A0A5E4AUA3_MARMO|nr:Hypothetical predicted protein [Marmota monax]